MINLRRLTSSSFARAVLAIGGATALAQVVAVAASPILTRLYPPDAYGTFFVVNAVSAALSAGLALRFELAIPLPKSDDAARSLVVISLIAVTVISVIVFTFVLIGTPSFRPFADESNARALLLVAPMAASLAIFAVLNAMAIRERRFSAIARRQLIVASLTVLMQIGLGLWVANAVVLAAAVVIAQLAGALSLFLGSPALRSQHRPWRGDLLRTLKRYKRFPLVLTPAAWLNSLGTNAPVLVIGAVYSSQAAGWFGLSARVLALPVALIGTAVGQVFVSELAARRREDGGDERALFVSTSRVLVGSGLLVAGATFLAGPTAFQWVFGDQWQTSGDIARAYAIVIGAQLIASPLSMTLVVYERLGRQIAWDFARLALTLIAIVAASRSGMNLVDATWVLAAAMVACYLINWWMCWATISGSAQTERDTRPEEILE